MAEEKKVSVREIREILLSLNNPDVPVETRQRALTSLFVEFCDRVMELGIETGQWFSTLNESMSTLMQPPSPADVSVDMGAPPSAPMVGQAPLDPAAQAAAELAMLPASVRGNVTPVAPGAPVVAAPTSVNGDAAAIAVAMNKTASVPVVPLVSQKNG